MGSQQSYGHNPTAHSKLLQTQEEYEIYESQSSEEYEKYQVYHDGSQDFQKNYQFRVENKHNDLVDVVFAGPKHGLIGCADRGRYEVITERIPQRLCNMKSIDSKHALMILKTALRGFRDLYRKHGIFGIKDRMIGINKKNKAKVWINHNFAVNRAEETPGSYLELTATDQEREMVHLRTEHSQLWRQLIHLNEVRNPCTFDEALNLIDYFCGANQLNLMDQLKKQKKGDIVVQPQLVIKNRNIGEEKNFRVNGSVPVQHRPILMPPSRQIINNNFTFQSQNRPLSILNSHVSNYTILPLKPPNTYFTYTLSKQQPIQVQFNSSETKSINLVSQAVTQRPQPHIFDIMPPKNALFNLTENIIDKETQHKKEEYHRANNVKSFAPQQMAQNQPITIENVNKVRQQTSEPTQMHVLKQPQIQVNINQIASEQSLSQQQPQVLKSNELDNHQHNYSQYKIVFRLEKAYHQSYPTQPSPFKQTNKDILKQTTTVQPTPSSNNKKISQATQREPFSYKEMRRLLLQELQA